MSGMRKLSAFRQLSLNCDTPNLEQRRKSLRKQLSEDLPEDREHWHDSKIGIKISFNDKNGRNFNNVPPIKIAWEEDLPGLKTDETVIIKKCKEIRRVATGKLFRQASLEKDSILNSKQEIADKLKQVVKEKEEKTNIKIFLANNTKTNSDETQACTERDGDKPTSQPILIPPLITSDNQFQIRKNLRPKFVTDTAYSPTRVSTNKTNARLIENNAVIVVPIIENEERKEEIPQSIVVESCENSKAINNVVIRPATAASRREKFQKRTNSAFSTTLKEVPVNPRPPLIRSSSAPIKPDRGKSKFVVSKRKIKPVKRVQQPKHRDEKSDEETEKDDDEKTTNQKVLNRTTAVSGNEVVTMVSLVSPSGSDCEEENEEKRKNVEEIVVAPKKEDGAPKIMSLRKAVKTVSFQQSSIHAIRSFSASFPGRRASLMLGNSLKTVGGSNAKVQEKRSTNASRPDDDERVPKRRLVTSSVEKSGSLSCEKSQNINKEITNGGAISVDLKVKTVTHSKLEETEVEEKTDVKDEQCAAEKLTTGDDDKKEESKTAKEEQCWDLYCKMTQKGINVSFDTILRGMLTPTEYRMSRKNFAEMKNGEHESDSIS